MDLYVKLGLLLVVSMAVTADFQNVSDYIPQLATNVTANVTDKAFVLVQPNCTFNQYPTTNVWLVVALNKSYSTLNDSVLGNPVAYSSFINGPNEYYHTLLVSAGQYPCSSINKVIQIGCELCKESQFCNGKLSNNYTYRVKFVLLNSTGVFAETRWSDEITLLKDISFPESSVWTSKRSGGMIVLTTILSVLLAILLVLFIIALVFGSQDICWKRTMDNEKRMAHFDFMVPSTYRSRSDHYDRIILTS